MEYSHTQRSPITPFYVAAAAIFFAMGWITRGEPGAWVLFTTAAVTAGIGLCFRSLTVIDDMQWLRVRFGPIPLFGTSIEYDQITGVNRGRSRIWDGWGIHYGGRRGWIFNLWGFDCVEVQCGARMVRIGTDDAEHLVAFLATKASSRGEG